MISVEKMQEIIEYLDGTCMSLGQACDTFGIKEEDLSNENLQQIDDCMFECEGCGWWCDLGEQNTSADGDNVCDDCIMVERDR